MINSKWFARLALLVTILASAAGLLEAISPQYSIIIAGISGALSAFLTRVQPVDPTEPTYPLRNA